MKLTFEVGEEEKHIVNFAWNQVWGSLRISVDEADIVARRFQLWSSISDGPHEDTWRFLGVPIRLVDRWRFEVGEAERHQVKIEKRRPKWFFAGFRKQFFRVQVDGSTLLERVGY